MVEEQFKLGLTVEIEQQGLPELRKLIAGEVEQAISVSADKVGKAVGGKKGTRAADGVSAGAIKSAADSVATSADDLAKKVVALASSIGNLESSADKNSASHAAAATKIDDAIKKLVGAISGMGGIGPGGGGGGGAAGGGGGGEGPPTDGKRLKAARREAVKEIERSNAAERAVSQNLTKFDVTLDQDIKELSALESDLSAARSGIKSFKAKLKSSEKEITSRKSEKRGTKKLESKLGKDKEHLAALEADAKALRKSISITKKQTAAVEGLISAAESHNQALRAAQESVSAVSTSSKATAASMEAANTVLRRTVSDLSGISDAADTLAAEIGTASGASTDLAKRVRNASEQMSQRGKVISEENKASTKLRKEKAKSAAAAAASAKATKENIEATKKDTKAKQRSAATKQKEAKRTAIVAEGKVGSGVGAGADKRRSDKAKAREKTTLDTELAAKGTGKALAQVKQARAEEARSPQQLREAKGPGGKKATGVSEVDKEAAKGPAQGYLEGAAAGADRLNKSFLAFEARVNKMFPNRPNVMQELGLKDFAAKTAEGAAVGMQDPSGQTKLMKGTVTVFEGQVEQVGDILGNLMSELADPKSKEMKKIGGTAKYREAQAVDMLRGKIAGATGQMDVADRGTVGGGLAQGGKVLGRVRLNAEQSAEATALKGDERGLILMANRIVGAIDQGLDKLTGAGYDPKLSSIGLSEGGAPIVDTVKGKGGKVEEIVLPLQARQLSQFVPMGAEGMKEQRILPQFHAGQMIGGEPPAWAPEATRGAMAAGIMSKESGKELVTAAVSMPEAMEDQIPISKAAAEKLAVRSFESVTVTELSAAIQTGVEILEDKIIGSMGGEAVKFELGAAYKATVASVQKLDRGEGEKQRYRVGIEKQTLEGMGGKGQTMGGLKGKLVVHDDLGKTESGQPIEVIIDPKSFAGRGDIQDLTYMQASSMSEATGGETSVQQAGDLLAAEMKTAGGKAGASLQAAVKTVSEGLGLKDFKGTQKITGGLIGRGQKKPVEAVTGKLHMRVAQDQVKSGVSTKKRFFSTTDLASAEMAQLEKTVAHYRKSLGESQHANEDLVQSLMVLTSSYEEQTARMDKEGIMPVMPSEFSALPLGKTAKAGEFAGTLADPEGPYNQATAMLLPRRQGQHSALRMGPVGEDAGGRGTFKTDEGEEGAKSLTRTLDKIREISTAIMVGRGEVDIGTSDETVSEAAEKGSIAINEFANDLEKRLKKDPGDTQAAAEFDDLTAAMAPFIASIQDASKYIKFFSGGKVKRGAIDPETKEPMTGMQYVRGRGKGTDPAVQKRNQVLAMRDLLFRRTTGKGEEGKNVPGKGKLFDPENVDELRDALDMLGVVMDDTSKRSEELYQKLEGKQKWSEKEGKHKKAGPGLVDEYYAGLAKQMYGRKKGTKDPLQRTLMEQIGGGQSLGMRGRATAIPGEVAPQLEEARKALQRLGQTGTDVGQALGAVGEMNKLQGDDVLPKDAILVNRADFDKWIQELVRFEGADADTAKKKIMDQGVILHRDPTTGGASMQKRRLMVDDGDRVEKGAVAVAGTFREGPGQLQTIMAPLAKELHRLRGILKEKGGAGGDEVDQVRKDFVHLSGVLNGLENVFTSLVQNLDFDGDQVEVHARMAAETSEQLVKLASASGSAWAAFNQIEGALPGTVAGSTLGSIEETFRTGTKGTPDEFRRAGAVPQTADQRESNVSSLVSSKLMVGKATEVHHRLLLALMAGVEDQDYSGAFRAVLGKLMLNINKSLKLKHTGAAGFEKFEPGEMVDFISKGDIKGLTSQMGEGQKFEELGKFNKKFQAKQEDELLGLDPSSGALAEGLKGRGVGDVIPKEGINKENYKSVIKAALKKMDIGSVLKEMHQVLLQGYTKSLEEAGLNKTQIKAKIKEKLKGKGKQKPKGLPMDEILATKFKPWLATRGQMENKMAKTKPFGQLKEMMSFLPKQLQDSVTDIMNIEDITIDKEAIMPKSVRKFAGDLRESLMSVRNRLGDEMEVANLPAGTGGRVKEGKIQVASEVMENLNQGMEALAQIESGELEAAAPRAQKAIKRLGEALGFVTHERVHQLGETKTGRKEVGDVRRSLASPRGTLGRQREEIKARMMERLPGVRKLAGRVGEWEAKAEEDPEKQRRAKIAGKDVRGTAGEIAGKLGEQLNNLIAEELLAYTAQGRLEDAVGDLNLGKGLDFLVKRVRALGEKDKEILGAAMASGKKLTSSMVEGLTAGLEGEGVDRAGVQARVPTRRIGEEILPGQAAPNATLQNQLRGLERVVTKASTEFSELGSVDPMAAEEGRLAMMGREQLRGRTAMEIPQVDRMNELIEKASTAGVSGEEEKELKDTAAAFKRGGTTKEEKQTGWKMYQKAIRQIQAAKSTFLINQARQIETELDTLMKAGKGGGAEFSGLNDKLKMKVEEIQQYLLGTTQNLKQPNLAQTKYGPTPEALAAGIVPQGQVFESAIVRARGFGEGPEAEAEAGRFKETEQVLKGMKGAIDKNVSASEQMQAVWEHIKQDPKIAFERLKKMAAVTSEWAQTYRGMGQTGAADKMKEVSKWVGQMANSMATMTDPTLEGMLSRLPKGQQQMIGGEGGAGLVMPMTDQMDAFEIKAKAHAKRLTQLIKSPQYKKMGLKPDFEPIKTDMIDPKTNAQVQKLQANFKKVGQTIEFSMEQGGVATQRFGRRMKDAFRRVVQWGFATGIVYGTMRAFRALSTVLTDVQDRVFSLKKVMDVTVTDFVKMQDQAVSLAKNYGIAINEVLDGMVVYGQQGLKNNEIMERTNATLLAVNVTTLDSVGATEALTAAHKVFGGEISNSVGFVDAWAKVAAKHAITAKDLADVVKKAGAAAGVAGMNFEDFMGITTAIGVVSRQTGKEIGTSLKFMMRGMRRPVAQKEFASLGISSLTDTGDLRPAMDLLKELAGTWHTLTKAQQLAAAQAAAGIRHYNSFIILMNNFDEALEASAHAATSQGFALRKNQLAMQTLSKQINVMKESLKGLGLEVGKAIVPTVTAATKALSVLLNVAGKIPGPMLQIGTLGLGGMLAFHKAADMVVDSLDAMMGYGNEGPKLKKFFGAEGYVGGIGKGAKKAFKGVFGGIGTALGMAMSKAVDFGPGAMKPTGIFDPKEQGLIVRGLNGMRLGVVKLASSLGLVKLGLMGLAGAAVAVAGVLLYKWYQRATATGQDMADQMHEQIGKARDLTDSYRAQATELSRVSVAQRKLAAARKLAADDPKMATAIASGEFKGAALAARDLRDVALDVGKVIAKIDPTSITDISDSGEFIWDMSDGFKSLAGNAVEAQNAIVSMMQVKVMKAFAEDISEAQGGLDNWTEAWNTLMQKIGMDPVDMSLSGKLKESQKVLQRIAQQRREAAERGWDAVGIEEQHIAALERHLNIQEAIGESAQRLKEILDRMPNFESFETFKSIAGADFWDVLNVGAASGKFGAGATASSIAFDRMAQETPATGAMVDYRSAANPAWMIEGLLEKGVKPEVYGQGTTRGAPTAADIMPLGSGEIMVASRAIAEALLKETAPAIEARDALDPIRTQSITAMQSLISSVDKDTGAAIWKWANAAADGFDAASADTMSRIIAAVDSSEANLAIYRAKSIEEAGLATERLLTMQFTGALAGIRDPGAFNIGPGTRSELTAEQRVMEALPKTLQRLVDLQKEMAEIQRTYNEQLGEGNVQEASAQMAKSAGAVKVMDNQLKELVMTLQSEGFEISRALHYNLAIKDLSKTLEEAAIVAEDAARAEDRRTQFVKHTSGALAGLPELPNLTFGKSKKDLTGLERLQQRMPGLSKIVKGFDKLLKTRDSMLGVITDVDKKKATFERAMDDLAASGEKLTDQQLKVRATQLAKGIGAGERAILKTMKDVGEGQLSYMKSQTEIQSAILDILNISATNTRDFSPEEMREYNKGVKEALNASSRTQLEAAARELPASARARALEAATGVEMISRDKREKPGQGERAQAFRIDKFAQEALFGKEIPKDFKELTVELRKIKQAIFEASTPISGDPDKYEASYFPADLEKLSAQEDAIISRLLLITQARDAYKKGLDKELATYIGANRSAQIQAEKAKSIGRLQRAKIETAKQQLLASKYFNDAQVAIIGQLGDATAALQRAAPHLRLSSAAEDLAKSLEDLIYDFKKAEMLELDPDRIESDLEGPFARVGKPGFKTDFETRREEAEAKLYGKGSKEEKEEARKEIVKIEFDIDEAKIKQKQDIEIKELKKQQDQASKFRDIMAEAMSSGEYAGTELSGRMKNFFTTLGHELETAEEASMRGGELRFKGVPSIQGVKGLIAEIKAFAEKKAKAAEYELMKKAFEEGGMKDVKANTDHLSKFANSVEGDIKDQTTALNTIVELMQGGNMGEHVVSALGVLTTELARMREAQRSQVAARAPASTVAATAPSQMASGGIVRGPRTSEKDTVPALLTPGEEVLTERQAKEVRRRLKMSDSEWTYEILQMAQGGIVPGVGGEQVAASVAKSRAGSISIPVDQLVKELYEFEDGFRAIVTRLKKSGGEGRIVGSQTFELHGARVRMEDTAIVDKGFRGEGIGPRQLEEVIRASKAEGVSTIGASESSLHESQRTAYTKAARETGAEVKMAKLGKEIEFDAKTKTYSPIGDYEGPILEVDLKNVKTDIERGFKSGFKKGTQEFLEKLQQRMAVVEGIRVHPSSGRAETLDQVAWEDAFASEGDPDAIARSPERAETAARIREAQAESTKALKARAAAPADAHLVAAELKEALAGNKANVAKAKARAPADADLLAEELREALAGNKDNAERSARIRAAQPAAGGQVVTDQLTTPPRQGREAFAGHPDEDMLDALADKIDDTGDIPGRGPKATAAGLRSAAEADQVARIIEQGEVIADIQGGPTAIQGERGAFFEAEGLTPESPEFEIRRAQEELRRTTAANEAQMEAEARARAEAKAAERTRRSRVDVDEYGQFTDESIPDELPDAAQRTQRMAEAAEAEKPTQWDLPDKSKGKISPKLKGFFSTFGKILAPVGALLQGMNIGGLAHKSERGMVDQDEIAKELGRELSITGLVTAGALGGGALGGPIGAVLGGLGGAGLGIADQYFGTDFTGTAGSVYDKATGGAISGGFQKVAKSGLATGLGDRLGENASSDSWIANAQLPTWLGGVDYGEQGEDALPVGDLAATAGMAKKPGVEQLSRPRTQDEWSQRIAEIQTVAPSVAGPPSFEMWGAETGESQGAALQRASEAGKMFLPSEFAPAAPMGTATPRVTQGTARTDYTGDAGFFTQEQQFKAAGAGRAAPRQAFEGVRSTIDEAGATQEILKALAEGARTFKPTGVGESLFNQPGGAQGGAQAYIENLQSARARAAERYGGASNAALVDDANTAAGLGVPRVQASDSTTSATGQTQLRGATAATEAAAAPTPTGGGEADTAVAQALETINATLAALTKTPLTIPESLASSIAAGSAAVVSKLNDVKITSMPAVDISTASATSIASNISTSTANAATVGAQQVIDVDELKNELIEAGGLIDTRISATTESFEARLVQGESESTETKALVDIHTSELGTINETLPAVEEDITGLKSTDLDLAVKVDLNAVEINTLDIEVTRVAGVSDITATTVEGFQTSIDDVLATSDQVTTRLGQFEDEFITISQDVSDAKSDAADATLAVRDLKISLTDFRDSLTSKDTQIEATISINAESAKKIRDKVSDDIIPDVDQLKTDVGTATSIAQAALNLALRKKDK